MAQRVGQVQYVDFRLADVNGNPITTRILSQLQTVPSYIIFTKNNVNTSESLSLFNYGGGKYAVMYTPLSQGHYYLEIYDQPTDIKAIDTEDIDTDDSFFGGGNTVDLTQDYGGVGHLKPVVASGDSVSVLVFKSVDWQNGLNSLAYVITSTVVDSSGNWLTTPLTVNHDTYHVVARNQTGTSIVLAAFLVV